MAVNEQSRRALDNLCEIYRLLESYGAAEYVIFDLGVIRDINYYTGMVFEAYTPGLGFPLCGGGRYDHMEISIWYWNVMGISMWMDTIPLRISA